MESPKEVREAIIQMDVQRAKVRVPMLENIGQEIKSSIQFKFNQLIDDNLRNHIPTPFREIIAHIRAGGTNFSSFLNQERWSWLIPADGEINTLKPSEILLVFDNDRQNPYKFMEDVHSPLSKTDKAKWEQKQRIWEVREILYIIKKLHGNN